MTQQKPNKDKKKIIKNIIIGTFAGIPFLSSLISTIHLVDLFELGNLSWMSITLAVAFEIGSIASLLILAILDKVNKGMVMTIFVILAFMQVLGNVYYSFDFINQKLLVDPNWLGSFQELVSYVVAGDPTLIKLMVSMLVGVPIPLIGLFFLKSLVDYLKFDEPVPIPIDEKIEPNFMDKPNSDSVVDVKPNPKFNDTPYSVSNKSFDFNFQNTPVKDKKIEFENVFKTTPIKDIKIENVDTEVKFVNTPVKDKKIEFDTVFESNPTSTVVENKEPLDEVIKEFNERSEIINKKVKDEIVNDPIDKKPIGPSNVSVFQNNNVK